MSDARTRMLSTIREQLVKAVLPASAPQPPVIESPAAQPDRSAALAQFTAAFTALTGRVHRVATPEAAAAAIVSIANDAGAAEFISWNQDTLSCPGLLQALAGAGLRRVTYDVPADPRARDLLMQRLGPVVLGITGADAALADSGAIVVVAGPGRGRLPSLLPPVHVAIVPVDRLHTNIGTLVASRPGLLDEASNVVAITGPSRTADIEMTLSHGVHGPKAIHAVLIG
jgi:L-lactate dehydrogenase complex protein LldG